MSEAFSHRRHTFERVTFLCGWILMTDMHAWSFSCNEMDVLGRNIFLHLRATLLHHLDKRLETSQATLGKEEVSHFKLCSKMHVCWLETQANLWEYKLKGKPHGTINTASTQLKVLLQNENLAVNPTPSYNVCHKYFSSFSLLSKYKTTSWLRDFNRTAWCTPTKVNEILECHQCRRRGSPSLFEMVSLQIQTKLINQKNYDKNIWTCSSWWTTSSLKFK